MNALANLATDSPIHALDAELRRQLASKLDLITDSRRLTLAPVADTVGDGEHLELVLDHPESGVADYGVTNYAHGQIADALGVPVKFYRRLQADQPGLLAHLATGLFQREPEKRMIRLLDGNVRAVLSNKFRPRDNYDLLRQAIMPVLDQHGGAALRFKECTLTDSRLYMKIVLDDREWNITPNVGDVVRGGLLIKNSEVGDGALLVAPFTDRLICTNGMVHTALGQRHAHVGSRIQEESWDLYSERTLRMDDAAFFAKCRDTVTAVLNEAVFEQIVEQMRSLAGIPLTNPVGAVQDVTKLHDLSDGEAASILNVLTTDESSTAWGLVNAITATARDHESPDRRFDLETLAGRITSDWALAGVN